jgi:ParB family chromosome partitioning protein
LSLNRLPEEIKDECRRTDTYPKRLLIQIARQKTPKAMVSLFNRTKAANLKSDDVKEISRRQNRPKIDLAVDRITGVKTYLEKINPQSFNDPETARLKAALQELQALLKRILA